MGFNSHKKLLVSIKTLAFWLIIYRRSNNYGTVIVTGVINTYLTEKTLHLTILNFALQSFMSSHCKAV